MTTAGSPWYQRADLGVLQAVDHVGDVAEHHRRAVAIGDHQRAVGVGGRELVVGRDGVGLMHAVERALRPRHIGADDRLADILEADAIGGEPRQVGLDAHRRPDAALHRDAADAGHLASRCAMQRVGEIALIAQRDGLRGQRQRDDRRVGRVHLGVSRRIGEVARQRRGRGVDRGLHVLRGAVDLAAEIELQRHLADAERARRGHQRQRRDLAELPFQRRRHQRRDGVGAGARKLGGDLDGRKVDLRQRRHRQPPVAEPAAASRRGARSEVAIGRRMKGVETLIAAGSERPRRDAPASRRSAAFTAWPAWLRGIRPAAWRWPAPTRRWSPPPRHAGGQPRKARGHHALIRLQAVVDDRLDLILLRHGDVADRHLVVGLHHIDECSVRPALHRCGRHHRHLFKGVDQQPDVDELARPELELAVGKFSLELDGAGGLVDLIVDDPELALLDCRLVVGPEHLDLQGAAGRRRG